MNEPPPARCTHCRALLDYPGDAGLCPDCLAERDAELTCDCCGDLPGETQCRTCYEDEA